MSNYLRLLTNRLTVLENSTYYFSMHKMLTTIIIEHTYTHTQRERDTHRDDSVLLNAQPGKLLNEKFYAPKRP